MVKFAPVQLGNLIRLPLSSSSFIHKGKGKGLGNQNPSSSTPPINERKPARLFNSEDEAILVDLMVDEVNKGNKKKYFSKSAWENIEKVFYEKTGKRNNLLQIRNKYNTFQGNYSEFNKMLKEPGFSWNPAKGHVIASNADWRACMKKFKRAKMFQKRGCPYYKKLGVIFGNKQVAGYKNAAPSTGRSLDSEVKRGKEDGSTKSSWSNSAKDSVVVEGPYVTPPPGFFRQQSLPPLVDPTKNGTDASTKSIRSNSAEDVIEVDVEALYITPPPGFFRQQSLPHVVDPTKSGTDATTKSSRSNSAKDSVVLEGPYVTLPPGFFRHQSLPPLVDSTKSGTDATTKSSRSNSAKGSVVMEGPYATLHTGHFQQRSLPPLVHQIKSETDATTKSSWSKDSVVVEGPYATLHTGHFQQPSLLPLSRQTKSGTDATTKSSRSKDSVVVEGPYAALHTGHFQQQSLPPLARQTKSGTDATTMPTPIVHLPNTASMIGFFKSSQGEYQIPLPHDFCNLSHGQHQIPVTHVPKFGMFNWSHDEQNSFSTTDFSITNCVRCLESIQGIDYKTFVKAIQLFKDVDWREMFVAMSFEGRCVWLASL